LRYGGDTLQETECFNPNSGNPSCVYQIKDPRSFQLANLCYVCFSIHFVRGGMLGGVQLGDRCLRAGEERRSWVGEREAIGFEKVGPSWTNRGASSPRPCVCCWCSLSGRPVANPFVSPFVATPISLAPAGESFCESCCGHPNLLSTRRVVL
jgi:hypothetical protein